MKTREVRHRLTQWGARNAPLVFYVPFGVLVAVVFSVIVGIALSYAPHAECAERGGKIVQYLGCIATRQDGTLERR